MGEFSRRRHGGVVCVRVCVCKLGADAEEELVQYRDYLHHLDQVRGTHGVLTGYSYGTQGVLTGYS